MNTSRHHGYTVSSIIKYIKRHPISVIILLCALMFLVYFFSLYKDRDVYTSSSIASSTSDIQYRIHTYEPNGEKLLSFSSTGVSVKTDYYGDYENGKRYSHPIISIDSGSGKMRLSDSTVVASPYSIPPVSIKHDGSALSIGKSYKYGKVLIIKSSDGVPIEAFHGYSIKQEYSNISYSQVFLVDDKLIYVYKGEFSILEASLLVYCGIM